jgi:hypothetical protein
LFSDLFEDMRAGICSLIATYRPEELLFHQKNVNSILDENIRVIDRNCQHCWKSRLPAYDKDYPG